MSDPMNEWKLNDVMLERTILGCVQIQAQFIREDGRTFSVQMPFRLGKSLCETIAGINELQGHMIKTADKYSLSDKLYENAVLDAQDPCHDA